MEPSINPVLRMGTPKDAPALLHLIKQLAIYERGLDQVTNTADNIVRDAFGDKPLMAFMIAEVDQQPVGMAVWYYRYSTWRGPCLYLEDLFVEPDFRHLGIGKALFLAVADIALREDCAQLIWQVLDWNQPAIDFYNRLGATVGGDGFVNAWLSSDQLRAMNQPML